MAADYLSDYQKLMVELKAELHYKPELVDKVKGYIEELEQQKSNAHKQYIETFNRLEEADYELTSVKKSAEHIDSTLKLSEVENKALKEVVRAHGQLAAVMFDV